MLELLVRPLAFTTSGTASNHANAGNERLGRTASFATGNSIDFDLGSAKEVDTMALLATSLASGDTVTWTAGATVGAATYSSGAQTALASPEGATRVHRQHLTHISPSRTFRYWRATISGGTRTVGRAVLGKAFQPLEGRDYGWDQRVVDMGEQRVASTGLDDSTIRGKVLEHSWQWTGLTKDEAENQLLELTLYAGVTRDVLWCADHSASNRHNLILYGKMREPAINTNYAENWYEVTCQILSRLVLGL